MNKVAKIRVVFTILAIVSIGFILHFVDVYLKQRADITQEQKRIEAESNKLLSHFINNSRETMKARFKSLLGVSDVPAKLQAIRNRDPQAIRRLFSSQYQTLKEQIDGFQILHFITPEGISLMRMHTPDKMGDDLKLFRPHIADIVAHQSEKTFFETGIAGLFLRHVAPIFDGDTLIGYLELGIQPSALMRNSADILGLKSYFFLKESAVAPANSSYRIGAYFMCVLCVDDLIKHSFSQIRLENSDTLKLADAHYVSVVHELKDAENSTIGKVLFLKNIEPLYRQMRKNLVVDTLLMLLTLLLIYLILERYITSLLRRFECAQLLLNSTNDAVFLVRLEDGMIVDVNSRASELLGYSREELLSMRVSDFKRELDNRPIDWSAQALRVKEEHYLLSLGTYVCKDGASFPVEASLSYMLMDTQEYIIAVVRDISKQFAMQKALEKEQLRAKRLHEVISKSSLYTTSDLKGNITEVSEALLKLTGYVREELIGKNHRIFKSPSNAPELYKNIWSTIGSQSLEWHGEIKNVKKNGDPYWIELTILPMYDEDGKKIGYYSYRENITDKKRDHLPLRARSAYGTLQSAQSRRPVADLLSDLSAL